MVHKKPLKTDTLLKNINNKSNDLINRSIDLNLSSRGLVIYPKHTYEGLVLYSITFELNKLVFNLKEGYCSRDIKDSYNICNLISTLEKYKGREIKLMIPDRNKELKYIEFRNCQVGHDLILNFKEI